MFILETTRQVFVWIGRHASQSEKGDAMKKAEVLVVIVLKVDLWITNLTNTMWAWLWPLRVRWSLRVRKHNIIITTAIVHHHRRHHDDDDHHHHHQNHHHHHDHHYHHHHRHRHHRYVTASVIVNTIVTVVVIITNAAATTAVPSSPSPLPSFSPRSPCISAP